MRNCVGSLVLSLLTASCSDASVPSTLNRSEPDWRIFRSISTREGPFDGVEGYRPTPGKFTFRDLKNESDSSLSERLLGAVGKRIVYVERHKDRWKYYKSENDKMDEIELYSRPESWGSAFGICKTEKYEISFADEGAIESVSVTPRFGVEGPIYQKDNFDWNLNSAICSHIPSNHLPSYFPSKDGLDAQDLAIILTKAISIASRQEKIPYKLDCQTSGGGSCSSDASAILGKLKLSEISEVSEKNCLHSDKSEDHCYTVTIGQNRVGPYPKEITVRGSTYMNNRRVFGVSIRESLTLS